jgi:hypothetical protein
VKYAGELSKIDQKALDISAQTQAAEEAIRSGTPADIQSALGSLARSLGRETGQMTNKDLSRQFNNTLESDLAFAKQYFLGKDPNQKLPAADLLDLAKRLQRWKTIGESARQDKIETLRSTYKNSARSLWTPNQDAATDAALSRQHFPSKKSDFKKLSDDEFNALTEQQKDAYIESLKKQVGK